MVITDSTKRPSERFIEIVSNYFVTEGYDFKKSKKAFIRTNINGYETVYLKFHTTIDLVSVTIEWSMTLLPLEKIFSILSDQPKKYKSSISLYTDLRIHTRWTIPRVIHTWDLFDRRTSKCDDLVLNIAATGIIEAYKTYVVRFFQYYYSYKNLEEILNSLPLKRAPFLMGYTGYGKRGVFGLLLASYFDNINFNLLIDEYRKLSESMPPDRNLDMQNLINKTISFLNDNDIQKIL